MYLESEPQYTEGVTFELSLRRSSVGHRDIIREEGVTGCGGSSFGRCDTHVRLRHNGPTSTALRYDELFSAQLWDNANIVRRGSGCSCCSDMVTPFLFLSYPSTHSSSATELCIYQRLFFCPSPYCHACECTCQEPKRNLVAKRELARLPVLVSLLNCSFEISECKGSM